jgi:hypothetical protein
MTKVQYQTIIKDIESRYNQGYRLRFNLKDGSWVQGQSAVLSNNILIVSGDNTKSPTYVDLGSVVQITVG